MRFLSLALAVTLFIPFDSLSAQQPRLIERSSRVRITAPDCGMSRQTSTVEGLRGDTLVLNRTECPLASVMRLDVSRGRHRQWAKGARIGGMVGGAIGLVLSVVVVAADCYIGCAGDEPLVITVFTAVGGVGGGIIGAGIGALIKTESWEQVPLDRLRVSFAPQRDGFALGLSVSF